MADNADATPKPPSREIEERQTRSLSSAVGHSLPQDAILDLQNFFRDARPPQKYEDYSRVRFMYEILYKDEWKEKVKKVVDLWVEDDANIQRAAAQVGRQPVGVGAKLLSGCCAFRLKKWDGDRWTAGPDSLGTDPNQPQTVVFLALDDLDSSNGFFMALPQGHDVCLDSRAEIEFPSTGGGLGVFIALKL